MFRLPPRRPWPTRRKRDAELQPSSPSDSGYGSGEDTRETSPNLRPRCFPSFDGSGSSDDPSSQSLGNEERTLLVAGKQESYVEPPKTPDRCCRRKNIEKLDRYVPKRDHASPLSKRYRTTKQSQDLSIEERLKRNKSASADPFVLRRRVLDPDPRFPFRVDNSDLDRGVALGQLPQNRGAERQVSMGAMWSVGGLAPSAIAVDDGQGHLLQRGTNARVFSTPFQESLISTSVEKEKHEGRIASALNIDQVRKILEFVQGRQIPQNPSISNFTECSQTSWNGYQWTNKEQWSIPLKRAKKRLLPAAPFKVLNAPNLKDDFYCSPLAYSSTTHTLVVCLGNLLYAWSEVQGVHMIHGSLADTWLTSVAFSSAQGAKAVLAIGHSDGCVVFQSLFDALPRFEVRQSFSIACVSWRPTCTLRPSKNPLNPGVEVQTEDLVVGDEMGNIYYYVVEWPMAKISNIHCQQICGLAWSHDGRLFATGGNDNLCCLFEADTVAGHRWFEPARPADRYRGRIEASSVYGGIETRVTELLPLPQRDTGAAVAPAPTFAAQMRTLPVTIDSIRQLGPGIEKHHWNHDAAVKAIAFCPWRRELVATGGGSNDKCIHFFHTPSGAALATISVSAQVTSLIWSTTRREIAATFGYASPEHPYRVSVFSWPECKQVAAIPWEGELRALYAIPYPRGPTYDDPTTPGGQEGCIVVASSDKSIKFHEVWSREKGITVCATGILGGSDILEGLEGIDKEGDVIR
ncbi:hypothetical protein F66182_701 [Fusarium sp. NRRL 66182]|nr:hypothetical protein F66182_701 [Fusarium sp. NRRL 66182]